MNLARNLEVLSDFMARYCFYCGRQLNTGERCTCSVAQQKRAADNESTESVDPRTASAETSQADSNTKSDRDTKHDRRAKAAARKSAKREAKVHKTRIKQERASSKRRSVNPFNWFDACISFARNMIQSITKPTLFIQNASHPSILTALITQALECLLTAFVLMRMLIASNIGNLLAYGNSDINRNLSGGLRFIFFFRLFMVAFVLLAIRVLISNLITRFVGRTQLRMLDSVRLMTAGSIYFSFFLMVGLLLSSGSGIQTLLLLSAGYCVKMLIDHFAIRMDTGLSEDVMIRISLLNFLCVALVFGSVIGILTPNMSEFRASIPGDFA